jgi:succinate dehydrogenase/fumarate reductase flavoprotein subunit
MPAAIRAADAGASVIVVDTNYDVGGHAIVNGGNTALISPGQKLRTNRAG